MPPSGAQPASGVSMTAYPGMSQPKLASASPLSHSARVQTPASAGSSVEGGKERKDGAQYKKRKRRNGPGQSPVDRNGVHRPGESRHEPAESEEKTHERGSGGRRTRREDEEEADERDERHPLPAKRIKPRAKEKPHAQGAERARRFGPALPPVRRLAHAT